MAQLVYAGGGADGAWEDVMRGMHTLFCAGTHSLSGGEKQPLTNTQAISVGLKTLTKTALEDSLPTTAPGPLLPMISAL